MHVPAAVCARGQGVSAGGHLVAPATPALALYRRHPMLSFDRVALERARASAAASVATWTETTATTEAAQKSGRRERCDASDEGEGRLDEGCGDKGKGVEMEEVKMKEKDV